MLAHDMALAVGGTFLLRIEDIDQSRARPKWEAQIYDDLHWLGLKWPDPVMRQSERHRAYGAALDRLWGAGLLYPCTCNRRDVYDAASAPQEGSPAFGPDGIVYPGTCRAKMSKPSQEAHPQNITLRLQMELATLGPSKQRADTGATLSYLETKGQAATKKIEFQSETLNETAGDVIVARKDMAAAYHLAVVIDDAAQGITDVVRGEDLSDATPIHVLLQSILDLPTPTYHHHRLIRDDTGRRLAKRDDARAISLYRGEGASPQDIRNLVGL